MGVFIGVDLFEVFEVILIDCFGRLGYDFYWKVCGIYNFLVKFNCICKLIGKEKIYGKIFCVEEDIKKELIFLLERVVFNFS